MPTTCRPQEQPRDGAPARISQKPPPEQDGAASTDATARLEDDFEGTAETRLRFEAGGAQTTILQALLLG